MTEHRSLLLRGLAFVSTPQYCSKSCYACYPSRFSQRTAQCNAATPIDAPCDDDPALAKAYAQEITLHFDLIAKWLLLAGAGLSGGESRGERALELSCDIADVFGGENAVVAQ